MKLTVVSLIELDNIIFFDYFQGKINLYTKEDLKKISFERGCTTYIASSYSKEEIYNIIMYRTRRSIVNDFLNPGENYGYINLDKVNQSFSPKEKLDFIDKFGKYLDKYELKSLISSSASKKEPLSYNDYLIDFFKKQQKKLLV